MKIKLLGHRIDITKLGIEGEDLIWLWPWKRFAENKWYSIVFVAGFPSFKDYQQLCDNYIRDCWQIHRFPYANDYETYPDGEQ